MGLRSLAFLSLLFSFQLATATAEVDTYDYIVVGSGPGGGPLASNLAKSGASVLLLEAGDDQSKNINETVGALFSLANNDEKMRWDFFIKYHTDPALDAKYDRLTWRTKDGQFYVGLNPPAGSKQLGVYYPRAGTLGGCSTHNAMCSAIPSQADWAYIANITGDTSWSPDNMTRHFIDLENDHSVPVGTKGHGFNGFLDLTVNGNEFLKNQSDAQTIIAATAKKMGQNSSDIWSLIQRDLNNNDTDHDQQTGVFGFPTHRTPTGRRVTAGTAVLETLSATNADGSKKYPLTLSLESFATKILFDTTSAKPKAIGIEYLQGQSMYSADPRYNASNPGIKKQAFARKEVIISGGTFNTPQLLKLSGIGPKAELTKFNISVIVDLPGVGTNLQDNPEHGAIAAAAVPALSNLGPQCTYTAPGDPCLEAWQRGQGPYAQGVLVAIMDKTSNATERDLFIFGIPSYAFRGYWPSLTVNTVDNGPPNTWDFSIVKIHPKSLGKGTVTLNSADPRDTPEINFRFFEGPGADDDIASIAEGVALGRSIFDSIPAPLGPFTETFPCEDGKRADCDVKERILTQSWSHHASSSCAIGADSNPMAVLDSKFRVRGVTGLRVVDASAFPRVPGGFPVIPTFMISMKASETILQDAKAM